VSSSVDEFLTIDTPENVMFGYEVAGIGSRFLAALIDTLLIGALQIVVYMIVLVFIGATLEEGGLSSLSAWVVGGLVLISFFLLWGYYIFFELLWNGQTPGKRVVGLRVIKTDGRPITAVESLVRNLVRLVDFMPTSYGVGIVTMCITEQSQRLGDMAAGTLVIFDRGEVTLDSLKPRKATTAPAAERAGEVGAMILPDVPVQRLTDQDVRLVEEFLRRRLQLFNADQMGAQITRRIQDRLGLPAQIMTASVAAAWLSQVRDAYHQRVR